MSRRTRSVSLAAAASSSGDVAASVGVEPTRDCSLTVFETASGASFRMDSPCVLTRRGGMPRFAPTGSSGVLSGANGGIRTRVIWVEARGPRPLGDARIRARSARAVLTGLEPAISTLTGWRGLQAPLQDQVEAAFLRSTAGIEPIASGTRTPLFLGNHPAMRCRTCAPPRA